MPRALPSLVCLAALAAAAGSFQVPCSGVDMHEPIAYTLRFPVPESHTVEIEGRFPTGGQAAVELMMPVWTPGSYLVREFARNVESLEAAGEGGEPLPVEKLGKNRWRVTTAGRGRAVVRYRLYAREMSVRTNYVDSGFALLNGAPTFLALVGGEGRPYEVRPVLPPGWRTWVSSLRSGDVLRAGDFATLVDTPLLAGNPDVQSFTVAGREHLLVTEGGGTVWDRKRAAADLERLVREVVAFWGGAPYPRYVFFNLLTEADGGLEHADSTVLMASRFSLHTRRGLVDWLGLAAHEHFHAWNVKRLRPAALARIDLEREVYTPSLWAAEGLTSYYDDLLVARAGLETREELLKSLSKQIETLQTSPGRLVQSLAESSHDAWIKYYRRDENFVNAGVSYYTKGALVGFLLDARIRRATGGAKSLDDVMRLLYSRHAGPRGYSEEELRRAAGEVAGTDLGPWFGRHVDEAAELDYGEALSWYGLRFVESEDDEDDDEDEEGDRDAAREPAGWLGFETEVRDARLVVTEVRRGTPGAAAGVNVDDEVLAIGDQRVLPGEWKKRLEAYRPGEKETLLVARRGLLVRLPVAFGEKPPRKWKLAVDPKATADQKAHLEAWLRGAATAGKEALEGAAVPTGVEP